MFCGRLVLFVNHRGLCFVSACTKKILGSVHRVVLLNKGMSKNLKTWDDVLGSAIQLSCTSCSLVLKSVPYLKESLSVQMRKGKKISLGIAQR